MTADRDLDRRVAEEVMGLEPSKDQKGMFITGNRQAGCPDGIPGCLVMHFGPITGMAPKYSSDPAACAEVKRRLRNAGIPFVVKYHPIESGVEVTLMDAVRGFDGGLMADTEERAVSVFALACAEAGLLEDST